MDIGKAFAFVFEDQDWIVKILIAAAILLIGFLFSWLLLIPLILAAFIISGYSVEITRRVIRGNQDELPQWDNWGQLITDGLKVWIIGVVYAIPIILVGICLGIPAGMLSEEAEGLSVFVTLVLNCLSFLWAIVMSLVLPAAIAFYVDHDDLSYAFRFSEIFALVRENFKTYLVTLVMSWIASLIGSLGGLVCGIGWLVTAPYSSMVIGDLYGQAYLEATGQIPAAAPVEVEEVVA